MEPSFIRVGKVKCVLFVLFVGSHYSHYFSWFRISTAPPCLPGFSPQNCTIGEGVEQLRAARRVMDVKNPGSLLAAGGRHYLDRELRT